MANRNMKVSVLVDLIDRLTAPLRGITQGIAATANRIGDLGRRIGLIGATLATLSFMAPIQQAAAWDTQLRDIAITAGKTGGAVQTMIGDLSKMYQKLAFDTGQSSMDVAKGAQILIASGMDSGLIEKLLPTIAKVATATNATLEDTAKTAFALSETLKVPTDQMEAMLGKLVTAGKLGRFEFKNMAMEFPELTAQMAKFGIVGKEAVEFLGSSLQIAMLGTANPSQAATNLNNFLTKINAPEAIKKFEKELKVDVTGVMTNATAKGINPIEAVIEKMISKLKPHQAEIDKIMKKAGTNDKQREDQIKTLLAGTNVGKLYADMQVLGFILPMMQHLDKFKEFREQLKTAGVGTIIDDFASRMKGLQPQLNQFGVLASAVGNRIGLAFASNLPTAMQAIQDLLKSVEGIDKKWPGLIDGTLSWGGALLVLGAGLAVLTPVIGALVGLAAVMASPFVIGAALIAGAAWHIWKNWEKLGPEMGKIFGGLKEAAGGFGEMMAGIFTGDGERTIAGARQMMSGVATALDGGWEVIKSVAKAGMGAVDAVLGTSARAIDQVLGTDVAGSYERLKITAGDAWISAMQKGGEFVAWIRELPGRIGGTLSDLAGSMKEAGANAIQGLWDGMMAKFDALIGWFKGKIDQLKSMMPSLGPGIASPPVDPMGNATGGPASFNPTSAPGSGIGGSNGFTRSAGGPASNSNVNVGGRILIEAAQGTRILNVQSDNPAVPVTPNRGTMLGRA